jgi:hypothetical protein
MVSVATGWRKPVNGLILWLMHVNLCIRGWEEKPTGVMNDTIDLETFNSDADPGTYIQSHLHHGREPDGRTGAGDNIQPFPTRAWDG